MTLRTRSIECTLKDGDTYRRERLSNHSTATLIWRVFWWCALLCVCIAEVKDMKVCAPAGVLVDGVYDDHDYGRNDAGKKLPYKSVCFPPIVTCMVQQSHRFWQTLSYGMKSRNGKQRVHLFRKSGGLSILLDITIVIF